mgnify:CR=1 FL=1
MVNTFEPPLQAAETEVGKTEAKKNAKGTGLSIASVS